METQPPPEARPPRRLPIVIINGKPYFEDARVAAGDVVEIVDRFERHHESSWTTGCNATSLPRRTRSAKSFGICGRLPNLIARRGRELAKSDTLIETTFLGGLHARVRRP